MLYKTIDKMHPVCADSMHTMTSCIQKCATIFLLFLYFDLD